MGLTASWALLTSFWLALVPTDKEVPATAKPAEPEQTDAAAVEQVAAFEQEQLAGHPDAPAAENAAADAVPPARADRRHHRAKRHGRPELSAKGRTQEETGHEAVAGVAAHETERDARDAASVGHDSGDGGEQRG